MSEQQPLLVNLGDGVEPVRLNSWQDVERWLANEEEAWRWLSPNGNNTNPASVGEVTQERLRWIRQTFQNHQANGQPVNVVQGAVDDVFHPLRGPVVPSQSAEGMLILDTRASCGDDGAAAAAAFHLGRMSFANVGSRPQLNAILMSAFPAMEKAMELKDRLSQERANFRSLQRNALADLEAFEGRREGEWKALLRRASGIGLRRLRNGRDTWKAQQSKLNDQQVTAIADINEVRNAYEEAMRLQAPVRYWTQKAKTHGKSEFWAIIRLCVYFPLALGLLGWAFFEAFELLINGNPARPNVPLPAATYLVVSGGLIVASTFAFWIGRLFTKLYLSEHHLRKDAHERAIMTTTYLALIRTGAASENERTIILEALFRPSPDGIVKDEGPSELNVGSLLARLGTR